MVFADSRLLKVAISRSLKPLSFVSKLQKGLQTSPQLPVHPFNFCIPYPNCTTRMPFFGIWFTVSWNCWQKWSTSLSSFPDVGAQTCMIVILKEETVLRQTEIRMYIISLSQRLMQNIFMQRSFFFFFFFFFFWKGGFFLIFCCCENF